MTPFYTEKGESLPAQGRQEAFGGGISQSGVRIWFFLLKRQLSSVRLREREEDKTERKKSDFMQLAKRSLDVGRR